MTSAPSSREAGRRRAPPPPSSDRAPVPPAAGLLPPSRAYGHTVCAIHRCPPFARAAEAIPTSATSPPKPTARHPRRRHLSAGHACRDHKFGRAISTVPFSQFGGRNRPARLLRSAYSAPRLNEPQRRPRTRAERTWSTGRRQRGTAWIAVDPAGSCRQRSVTSSGARGGRWPRPCRR